jgi:hypothetical protein
MQSYHSRTAPHTLGAGAKILPFRPRAEPHACAACGYPLCDRPNWWRLCLHCFRGAQLERALRIYGGRN